LQFTSEQFRAFLFSRQLKHAIKTAIAAIICLILYKSFYLPKGYWAVLTAIAVMQSTADTGSLESTWRISLQRLLGTMTGAIIGLSIHVLIYPNYWQLIIILFFLIIAGVYLAYLWPSMKTAGVTAVIILLFAGHQPMSHNYAVLRALEILLGAMVALMVSVLIWPQRMHQYLYKNYLQNMRRTLDLFQAVAKSFSSRKPLSTEQSEAMRDLLTTVDGEKVHLDHLMKSRKLLISNILLQQIRLLKNIKTISKSIDDLPEVYYTDVSQMKVTQKVLFIIDKALSAVVENQPLGDLLKTIEAISYEYDLAFEDYLARKYVEHLNMIESYAIVSLSISLKKMLDLVAELLKSKLII
jgi:uncharacterized membrane protein YccC